MKTTDFLQMAINMRLMSRLVGGVAAWNADAYCIVNEDLAEEILNEILENDLTETTDEEDIKVARLWLDYKEDDDVKVYRAGGCVFTLADNK